MITIEGSSRLATKKSREKKTILFDINTVGSINTTITNYDRGCF